MIDLTGVRLFAGLTKNEAASILRMGVRRQFNVSETIFEMETAAKHLILISEGLVNFHIITQKGERILLRCFVPGETLGIAAFLSEPVGYLGTATCVNSVEVVAWEHRTVLQLANTYPRISQNAFRIALMYIAEFAHRHASLFSDTAQARLAQALTGFGARAGHPQHNGVEVQIKNEDLASLADVSPFTASRQLQEWERMGAVAKSRGKVLIRCPEKLFGEKTAA
jgi:CRP-like cAMP-binding protein